MDYGRSPWKRDVSEFGPERRMKDEKGLEIHGGSLDDGGFHFMEANEDQVKFGNLGL